ncbi:alkaline phosphatase family protein [Cytophagales bacterium WSM2-2]|nr:alkaline phosphatase family protein [Cytophagales bacterium WSM2-2]
MRQEYLYRFENKFGDKGFKRLIGNGFMLTNAHYNYVPTFTGPGHSSIYTGTTPAIHGIIGNEWWDKNLKKSVSCVDDDNQKPVGNDIGGGLSPWRLLSTTITDELKLASQKKSKVIGISMKARSSAFPAGHFADAAYWYNSRNGEFVSSTFYLNAMPSWVEKFNTLKLADRYLNTEWNTVYPIEQYTESGPDDSPYERKLKGKDKPVFPYDLKKLRAGNEGFDLLLTTPFGNDFITEFAKTALVSEGLGKGIQTDFLTISFSSTDYVGHAMGPNSIELEDTYIRLDKNLEDLLSKLDTEVGKDNYIVFLSADHAVVDVPQSLKDAKLPAGNFPNGKAMKEELNTFLQKQFPGRNIVEAVSNQHVYFDQSQFTGDPRTAGIDLLIATELTLKYLEAKEGVAQVFTSNSLRQGNYNAGGLKGMIIRGYNHKRSGDVVYELEPGWLDGGAPQGTSHGSAYTYDTHVPMLFYGKGIRKGTSAVHHDITDIAPTLAVLLRIKFPSGCTGQPIIEIVDGK